MKAIINDSDPYRKNITVNYLYSFLQSLNITHGFWMIFLASKGMSLVQLGLLEGVFHLTSFVMETPTGAIADLYGRKTSRILGRFINISYIMLLLFGTSFVHYLIGFILCAISWNLESGAGDAFVYDSLLEIKEEDRYMKVNGWIEVVYQSAMASALILGGWIAARSYEALFGIQIIIILAAAAVALLFKETKVGRENAIQKKNLLTSIKEQYVHSFSTMKGNNRLIYLVVFLNAMGVFTTTVFFYMQIYCKENGINERLIGLIFAVSCILGAAGGVFAHKIERAVKERGLLIALPIAFMIVVWGLSFPKTVIASFMIMGFFDSVLYVVYSDYINRMIPSDKRATLLSFSSMVYSFFMIFIFPIFGAIGDAFGLKYSFVFLAAVSTVLMITNLNLLKLKIR